MIKSMRIVPTFLIGLLLIGCTINTTDKESEKGELNIVDEVMAIHDSVMPKMGDMRRVRKSLLDKAAATPDSTLADLLTQKADQIDSAHESMMSWMRQFNPLYFEEQRESIRQVKDLMENSLKEGKELIE